MSDTRAFANLLRRLSRTYRLGFALIALVAAGWFAITEATLAHLQTLAAAAPPAHVALFQQESLLLERAAQISGLSIVVLLALEAVLVFRPALRWLRREREVQEQTRELRDRALDVARAAEIRRAEVETRFRSSFDSAAIGMALVSFSGTLSEVNKSLCEMLGYSELVLNGMHLTQITHPDDALRVLEALGDIGAGRRRDCRLEHRYTRRDGQVVWALVAIARVPDANGKPLYAVVQAEDISARKRAEENAAHYASELRQLALTDDLTRVHNRRGFRVLAEQACLAQQRSQEPLMLVAVDLDRLKFINDRFGHAAGDRALIIVATALVSTFRTSDIIGRMGGDEFVCLLPNAADMTEAQVKSRLEARLAQLSSDLQEEFPVTAAIGLATAAPMVTVELDALVREADRALYGAKHARLEDDLATPPVGQPNRLR